MRGSCLGLFLAAVIVSAAGAGAAPAPVFHLVDDQGHPVSGPVEVCFRVELRTDCRRVSAGEDVRPPTEFYSVRIEGEDYGPVDLPREALPAPAKGSLRLAIPRKALLRIDGRAAGQQPLTVSLYRPQSPDFREPAVRILLKPGQEEVKVPAGEHIVSLALPGNAPDLQQLSAQPGGRHLITYHPHRGWSLVARVRSAATFQPVPGAHVVIAEAVGYGQAENLLAKSDSGPGGLVLVSGIEANMARLDVRHDRFILAEVSVLTASPGSFAFREVDLGTGGRIVAQVTVHGRPLEGAVCQVHALAPDAPDPRTPYRLLWEGGVDEQGVCRSSRLAQGDYKLQVRVAKGAAQVSRWVGVVEAQDSQVDLPLAPTRVSGKVRRATEPAPGYSVEASLIDLDKPQGARGDVADVATSDEAGHYELTLWTPGWYTLHLRSSARTPAAGHQELRTEGDEERKVDFELDASPLAGKVVDEEGRPVEKARVALRWQGLLTADTDAEGRFEIEVEGEGTGTLSAGKPGYREADPIDVLVKDGTATPPVTLTLKRKNTARATLLSADGHPVPGAWVGSSGFSLEQGPFLFSETRSNPEGTFEVEVPPGPSRLFVSGPACPLSGFDPPSMAGAAQTAGESPAPPVLHCPPLPAALEMTLVDDTGKPLPHAGIILRRDGEIVPQSVLASHLRWLGLSSETDGGGHLILAGLAPGAYELFLAGLSSESTIAGGRRQGFLTAVVLSPLQTASLQVTLPR
jgi:hypothetical protein